MKYCGMVSRLQVVGWTGHTTLALSPHILMGFPSSHPFLFPSTRLALPSLAVPCRALSWLPPFPLQEFLLVRPTKKNLELYESWIRSPTQSQVFFGDLADTCYRSVYNIVQ